MHIKIRKITDLTGYRSVAADGVTIGRVSQRRSRRIGAGYWYGFIRSDDPDKAELHFNSIQDMKAYLESDAGIEAAVSDRRIIKGNI